MKSSTTRALGAMKQSTSFAQVATNLLNVLQGYTKGIRFTAILTFLFTIGVGQMWGADTWELVTDYTNLSTSDVYVIAGNIKGGSTWYALKNNQVTSASNLPCGSTLTIKNNQITSTITENDTWVVEATSTAGVYYIKSTKGAYYLQNAGATGSKITSKSSTDQQNQWRIHYEQTSGSNTVTGLYNVGVSRELGCYNSTTWRCYTTSNYANLKDAEVCLYRKVASCSNQVTITKASVTGGSFKVHQGTASGTEISSGGTIDNCDANAVVVVVPSASANYTCTSVNATNSNSISGPDGSGNYTITYTKDSNISSEISVTFTENQKHSVTWKVNNTDYNVGDPTTQVYDGGKVTKLPTAPDPANNCGEVFAGWTTTPIDGTTNDKPAVLFTTAANSPDITEPTTFYAVFADYEQ